jgi:hypothetical protein
MDILKSLLDWSAAVAWPAVAFAAVLMFRRPVFTLLERFGSIADRASREAIDIQLGEKLKLSFREAIEKADPKTVQEAVAVAKKEADRAISIFEQLARVPMQQHHKDLLLKVARGGNEGIHWEYKGLAEHAPGRTMGFLLDRSLVRREGDRYYAHPAVREYILSVHGREEA